MRRNISLAAFIALPLAMAAIGGVARPLLKRFADRKIVIAECVAAGLLLAVTVGLMTWVNSNRFYFAERSPVRMGLADFSRLILPVDAAAFLRKHLPALQKITPDRSVRLWTNYNSSSHLFYFVNDGQVVTPKATVPILTNTWAYPPAVMQDVLNVGRGWKPFSDVVAKYAPQAVALRVDSASKILTANLAGNDQWRLVHIDALHVVFLPAQTTNALGLTPIRPEDFENPQFIAEHIKRLREMDPVPAHVFHVAARTLWNMGWISAAEKMARAAVKEQPTYFEAWDQLGLCLSGKGRIRRQLGDDRWRSDAREAREYFQRCLSIRPDYKPALAHLIQAERDLKTPR